MRVYTYVGWATWLPNVQRFCTQGPWRPAMSTAIVNSPWRTLCHMVEYLVIMEGIDYDEAVAMLAPAFTEVNVNQVQA